MTQALNTETENRIVEAATLVFVRKGKAGTSMQDIAAEAGINRTLLNYYFRSKDKLFDLVFQQVFSRFLPNLVSVIHANISLEDKIINVIDRYHQILQESPYTAVFVLHEVSAEPQRLVRSIRQSGIEPGLLVAEIERAMEEGKIKKADPKQVLVNLLGLIIFPFAARTVIEGMLFSNDGKAFDRFISRRRAYVKQYFIESIKA